MSLTNRQKQQFGQRVFAHVPTFDPEQGETVLAPEAPGYGNWVGGHSVVHDPGSGKFFMFYRLRKPFGYGRGAVCRIAESSDGVKFSDIWQATADQLGAESIEVGSLIRDPATQAWRLYVSYQVPGKAWQVDLIEGPTLAELDPLHHRAVMPPYAYGVRSIKDPRVYLIGGLYHAFVATPAREQVQVNDAGVRRPLGDDATALLTSEDGVHWLDFRYVLEPEPLPGQWGYYRARINSIVWLEPMWVAFFDAGQGPYDNCDEWAATAISSDLTNWRRVTRSGPWVRGAHGGVRYVDALRVGDTLHYYYEYTRADGSHELRVSRGEL